MLEASLTIAGPKDERQTLLKRGAQLPARAKAVFATQRAGERTLSFRLFEGEAEDAANLRLIGTYQAELPAGLPHNTWLTVQIEVSQEHAIQIAVKENLRRINVTPECDTEGATATTFRAG